MGTPVLNEGGPGSPGSSSVVARHDLAQRIGTITWALFFIWAGIALLLELGVSISLVGIGVITLGGQEVRRRRQLKIEWFWVLIGLLFVVVGIWELIETETSLLPILLIVTGLVLLLSSLRKKHPAGG